MFGEDFIEIVLVGDTFDDCAIAEKKYTEENGRRTICISCSGFTKYRFSVKEPGNSKPVHKQWGNKFKIYRTGSCSPP